MLSGSARLLVLCAVAGGVCAAAFALPACGARTGLPVPPVETETCVVSTTAPGKLHDCEDHATSISGTLSAPAAKQPLYNVVVYVPSSTPQPFAPGASCDSCNQLYTGNPIATA